MRAHPDAEEPTVYAAVAAQILSSTTIDAKENEDMGQQQHAYRPISREELDEIAGETLSEQAATSLLKAGVAIPVDASIAPEVLSAKRDPDADDARSR